MKNYQKALDFLCNHAMEYIENYDYEENNISGYEFLQKSEVEEYRKPLQSLIDKATPIKPFFEGDGYFNGELVLDTWYCPNCNESYEVDYQEYDYCPNCGQALYWEDNND